MWYQFKIVGIVIIILLTAVSAEVKAQTASEYPRAQTAPQYPGYIAPDSPALMLLGATTMTLDRPASAAKLGAALVNMVTPEGNVRAGVGIEFRPGLIWPSFIGSYYEYLTSYWSQFVGRFSLSLASVAETAEETEATVKNPAATRMALGFKFVFIDESDPLLDRNYLESVKYASDQCKNLHGSDEAKCRADVYGQVNNTATTRKKRIWNQGGLILGGAHACRFEESKIYKHKNDIFQLWLIGALGFRELFQGVFGYTVANDFIAEAFETGLSVRLRAGNDRIRSSFEGGWLYRDREQNKNLGKVLIGIEVRIADQMWICTSAGVNITGDTDPSKLLMTTNMTWAREPAPW